MGDLGATRRRGIPAVALTVLLVALTVPHAIEDFRYGEFAQHHVPPAAAAFGLAVVYAIQIAGIALTLGGRAARGLELLAAGGIVWCVGALVIHGPEIVAAGDYRDGWYSKGLEIAIIAVGAAVAAVAAAERRRC